MIRYARRVMPSRCPSRRLSLWRTAVILPIRGLRSGVSHDSAAFQADDLMIVLVVNIAYAKSGTARAEARRQRSGLYNWRLEIDVCTGAATPSGMTSREFSHARSRRVHSRVAGQRCCAARRIRSSGYGRSLPLAYLRVHPQFCKRSPALHPDPLPSIW